MRGKFVCVALTLALFLAGFSCPARTADLPAASPTAVTSPMAVSVLSPSLKTILDGSSAIGVGDLRAMQGHVASLTDRLKKCTVSVQVDNDRGSAWGSGVIISKDGYVLTAAHVAGQPNQKCQFTLHDGSKVDGKTLGLFRTLDAGVMKITDDREYSFAELGDSNKVKTGNWCIALGHPGGYQEDRGLVLRLGRVLLEASDRPENAITTTCTLVGGDSGGPLFDLEGKVIGINSRIGENSSTNMHVPVNAFHDQGAWERMLKGEAWGRLPGQPSPWLGVGGDDSSKEAKIGSVGQNSPAEKFGLKAGDIVVGFDGREIADFKGLQKAVADCRPNEWIRLKVRRASGQVEEVGLKLGRRPE